MRSINASELEGMSSLERNFFLLLVTAGLDTQFVREYRFDPVRKWRADFADLEHKILIELEGGSWVYGAHSRGAHFASDAEKYNAAVCQGWRLLRYTGKRDFVRFLSDYEKLLSLPISLPVGRKIRG
jgi:very-short-patch-repair endonuclease